jgi:Na+/H+ antiporter NhaD/arsenite permease-like protein
MNADQMIQRPIPRVLQYGSIQLSLFVLGIMLAVGAVQETGVLSQFSSWLDMNVHNIYVVGAFSGLVSTVLDNFATAMSSFSLYPVIDVSHLSHWADSDYMSAFVQNGAYWKVVAYFTAIGGSVLSIGSMSGLALMKMERMHLGWYIKNFSGKVLLGLLLGFVVLFLQMTFL